MCGTELQQSTNITRCYTQQQNKLTTRMITELYLHGYWEVILCFRWKEHIDGFLGKWLIALRRLSNLDHMQLSPPATTITHSFTLSHTDG